MLKGFGLLSYEPDAASGAGDSSVRAETLH